jgi:hypothetical protein
MTNCIKCNHSLSMHTIDLDSIENEYPIVYKISCMNQADDRSDYCGCNGGFHSKVIISINVVEQKTDTE